MALKSKEAQVIGFGDVVRDTITGFTGKAVGYTQWATGCDRWVVQPPVEKDGKLPDPQSFDIVTLELVQKSKTVYRQVALPEVQAKLNEPKATAAVATGGPRPTPKQF